MKKLYFILFLLLLVMVVPTSGWSDDFTGDTSGSYNFAPTSFTWQSGYVRYETTIVPADLVYKDSVFGSGIYNWTYKKVDTVGINQYQYGSTVTSGAMNDGYAIYTWLNSAMYLYRYDNGISIQLDINHDDWSDTNYNISVFWDQSSGSHKVYLDNVLWLEATDDVYTSDGYMGVNCSSVSRWAAYDEWRYTLTEGPTPTPTPTSTPLPSEINPHVILKGKTFIYWGWNETGINYTYLDGVLVNLNNGTYVYSNLIPNTKHILTLSYDGINETSSIVFTDKEYNYDVWLVPLIGLVLILGFKLSPTFPFLGFLIILINLASNPSQFNDVEKIVNILFIITGLLLFKFKFGDL